MDIMTLSSKKYVNKISFRNHIQNKRGRLPVDGKYFSMKCIEMLEQ